MVQIITATFEDGVLKPHEPLQLPPHARVRLVIEPLQDDGERQRQAAWTAIEQLWAQSTIDSHGERLARDQLHERR
jgi:predicted DNA-binding antitoxin AbrB/MazE fold protein